MGFAERDLGDHLRDEVRLRPDSKYGMLVTPGPALFRLLEKTDHAFYHRGVAFTADRDSIQLAQALLGFR